MRIKESALGMFAQHGFSISIAKIADHAGISKQALMYHYPSKSKLLQAVMDDIESSSISSLLQFFSLLLQTDTEQNTQRLEEIIATFVDQNLWAVLFLRLVLATLPLFTLTISYFLEIELIKTRVNLDRLPKVFLVFFFGRIL